MTLPFLPPSLRRGGEAGPTREGLLRRKAHEGDHLSDALELFKVELGEHDGDGSVAYARYGDEKIPIGFKVRVLVYLRAHLLFELLNLGVEIGEMLIDGRLDKRVGHTQAIQFLGAHGDEGIQAPIST